MATGLENELTQKEKYDLIMADMDAQFAAYGTTNPFADSFSYTQDDLPYNTDENGVMYNDDGERVYFYQGSQESANGTQDNPSEMDNYGDAGYYDNVRIGAKRAQGKFLTQAQIEEQWNGGEMNQFRDAHPDMDFDTYWSYIEERQGLIESGELSNGLRPTDEEFWSEDGEWLGNDAYSDDLNNEAYTALLDKYGIKGKYYDEDGNGYVWNGSGYTKIYDVPKADFRDYALMATSAVVGIVAGPAITSALTPTLGAAGAKAASAAIVNMAKQYVTTGELDWGDALLAAATSYGGAQLSEALNGSGVIGDIGSQINDFGNSLMEGGGDILSAALQAGGMSLVTQMVQEGEIDWKDAAIAAAMAGGTTALQGFLSDIGKSDQMDDLSEWDEFDEWQEEAMKADIKDPFLNPNYETVGDGLVMNIATGEVFSQGGVDSKSHGLFSDLDTDGDGQLSGSDLEFIDTDDLTKKNIYNYELGDTVYVDANGNPVNPKLVREGPDGPIGYDANGNRVPLTATTYDQVFGGGKGELEWQFGLNEDGSVSATDGAIYYENGELAYEKVNGQWQDSQGNIIDDPTKVDELTMIAAKAIDEPLNSVTYFDQDGNPISYKYPPADLQDNYEQGQFSGLIFGPNGEVREVWYDPVTNTEYVKAQGTTEIIAIREPETPPAIDNSTDQNPADGNPNNESATGDPNDSSDAGMGNGGGNTDSTGGDEGADGTAGGSDGGSTGGGYTGGGIDTGDIGSGGDDSSSGTTTPTPTDPNANPVDPSGGNTGGNTDNTGGNTTNDSGNGTNTGSGTESGAGGVTGSETGTGSGSGSGDGSSSGTESGSGNTGTGSGTGSSDDGAGSDGTTGGGSGAGAGTGGGVGGGAGSDTGGGEGDVDGSGSGTEAGSGDGAGGGGAGGGGLGSGQGMLSGNNTSDRPVWGPLFAGTQFRPRDRARAQLKGRLFDDLFKDYI